MARLWKTASISLAVALAVTACGAGAGTNNQAGTRANGINGHSVTGQREQPLAGRNDVVRPLQNSNGYGALQTGTGQEPVVVPFVEDGGKKYISVDTLVDLMQFEHDKKIGNTRAIGDKDVLIRLKADSLDAEKEGDPFKLPDAPKMANGQMLLTPTAAADLFSEEMVYEIGKDGLVLYPSDTNVNLRDTDEADSEQVDPSLDFADDPNDPFKGEDAEGAFSSAEEARMALEALEAIAADPEAVPALKNININGLISTAKKYMGVPYDFGADPYPQSNRFDCSSFTQYVFGKYGIDLPRTARAQMKVGQTVSRKSLRKGDLLFFYVPGRFKSNKVAGHVGIYIGNRTMIHSNTEPKNGVQLRSIDRAFWKKTFLTAKRLAY